MRYSAGVIARRRLRSVLGLGVVSAVAACADEFPSESAVTLSFDSTLSRSLTLMVRDTDTVALHLSDPRGSPVAGLEVEWESSDPESLELRLLSSASPTRRDTLRAQLSVQVIAHRRGTAVATATVVQPGVAPTVIEHEVDVLERWISVTAGADFTCGLTVDQDAYCWGGTARGEIQPTLGLGNGTTTGSAIPTLVLGGHKFSALAAGGDHTCGVTLPTGLLYCWGQNRDGELGIGGVDVQLVPAPILGGRTFKAVSGRTGVTCGVTDPDFFEGEGEDRNALCWGRAAHGALGFLSAVAAAVPCDTAQCIPKPSRGVMLPLGRNDVMFESVSVGGGFVCGIAREDIPSYIDIVAGEALCWGLNNHGQVGVFQPVSDDPQTCDDPPVACVDTPRRLEGGLRFGVLSSGGTHSCGITISKALYCWGGTYGANPVELGGPQFDSLSVGGPADLVDDVPSSLTHACGLTSLGEAYCWGDNQDGELGSGELPQEFRPIHRSSPVQVVQDTLSFIAISVGKRSRNPFLPGTSHTCALTRDGAIYCWGSNQTGALGVSGAVRVATPMRISEPAS